MLLVVVVAGLAGAGGWFAWLAGSINGNLYLMELCSRFTPLEVEAHISRPLTSGLQAEGLRVRWPAGTMKVTRLAVDWQPRALMKRRLLINHLEVDGVEVTMVPGADEPQHRGELSLPVLPAIPFDIELRQLRLSNLTASAGSGKPLYLAALSASLYAAGTAINLDNLEIRRHSGGEWIAGNCRFELQDHGPAILVDLKLASVNLAAEIGLATNLNGTVRGRVERERYRFDVDLQNAIDDWQQASLQAVIDGNLQGLQMMDISARVLNGMVAGDLDISWEQGLRLAGRLTGRDVDLSVLGKNMAGSLNFTADGAMAKSDDGLVAHWDVTIAESILQGRQFAGIFAGSWQEHDLTIANLDFSGEGIHLSGHGRLGRRVEVALAVDDLDRLVTGGHGSLNFGGWFSRVDEDVRGQLDGDFAGVIFHDIAAASGKVRLSWPGGGMAAGRLELQTDSVRTQGVALDTLCFSAVGRPADHALTLTTGWAGGNLNLVGAGGWQKDRWAGVLQQFIGQEEHTGAWRLSEPVAVSAGSQSLQLGDFVIEGERGWRLQGRADLQLALEVYHANLAWDNLSLSLLKPLAGACQLEGKTHGLLRLDSEGDGRLTVDLQSEGDPSITAAGSTFAFSSATLRASWNEEGLRAEALLRPSAGGQIRADLQSPDPAHPGLPAQCDFDVNWENLPVAEVAASIISDVQLSGRWQGSLQGNWRGTSASFSLTGRSWIDDGELVWQSDERQVRAGLRKAEVNLDWQAAMARTEAVVLLAGGGRLAGRLELPLPARLPLAAAGDLPLTGDLAFSLAELGLAGVLFPGMVDEVRGRLEGELQVGGRVSSPVLTGRFSLHDAGGVIPDAGLRIEALTLKGSLADNRLVLEQLHLTSGGGALDGSGVVELAGWLPEKWNFAVQGDRVLVVDLPEWSLLVSPNLKISGSPDGIHVDGDILVPSMMLTGVAAQTVGPSSDVVLVGGQELTAPPRPQINANIRITLGDSVVVKAQGLDARLEGKIAVSNDRKGRYVGEGEIRIAKGRYAAYGLQLPISRGRFMFAGGPVEEPLIDVLAERVVGDVKTGMLISGTPRNPMMKLISTPVMPDADILSYLVLGRPVGEAAGQESALLVAANALMARGESVALQEQLKRRLGIDVLQVEKGNGGVEGSMVTIGKYLTPDLYLSFGQSLFSPVSLTTLRYRLAKSWELESQLGTVSGVDLSYRLEFW